MTELLIVAMSSVWIGWLVRGWREARISEQYADAVLDFFLNASQPELCLCDECYDPNPVSEAIICASDLPHPQCGDDLRCWVNHPPNSSS